MSHIVIPTYGSRGDILPLSDFASRLAQSGHDVVMTAPPELAEDLIDRGISVRTIDFQFETEIDPDRLDPLKAAR